MIVIVKATIVLVILVAMVKIVVGINQLLAADIPTEEEEMHAMQTRLEKKPVYVTNRSFFKRFLGRREF